MYPYMYKAIFLLYYIGKRKVTITYTQRLITFRVFVSMLVKIVNRFIFPFCL